ncbi:CBS domain-containing protein [Actinocrinis puniceicyclus]|uniref:CBS domain-containing protein n=1 Tax=Actinocrinis puniceicyclus TaxID=977794 RepID=A0A8J8BES8_9ACTN|nr:CBS domain-containing protein [Actinocrinis puniceicyclus]MBS2965890.1 CBS domain-containing protein [Actinocrinis puniceicyclus]
MNSKVRDVMTRDVVAVHLYTPFKDIARTLFDREISAVPVLDDSCHVTGIVCAADLVEQQALGSASARPRVRSVSAQTLMTSPVVTVTADTDTATAARLMYRNAVKHLPVVSDTGRLVGIVSEKDLLTVFLRPDLDIQDEIVRTVILAEPESRLSTMTVRVRDGIVLASGHAADEEPVRQAIEQIRAVDGVIEVIDRVEIGPVSVS